jgi:NAD-dependent deacetylase
VQERLFAFNERTISMRIVFFTGAGISRESGLKTFRDEDGLWNGYPVEEVCSTRAWEETPERVLDFYNQRRRDVRQAEPNAAHHAIAALEDSPHTVTVITQNINDLQERAGSRNVLHLHGEIMKSRSVLEPKTFYDCPGDIAMGDCAPDGGQLRPHVVLFGELLYNYASAKSAAKRANILVVVGTSLVVYPAAYLVSLSNAPTVYVIDHRLPDLARMGLDDRKITRIPKPATEGVPDAIQRILTLHAAK